MRREGGSAMSDLLATIQVCVWLVLPFAALALLAAVVGGR